MNPSDPRSRQSEIIDSLHLAVLAERDVSALCELPVRTIAAAHEMVADLMRQVSSSPELLKPIDAVNEHLETLAWFREEKLLHCRARAAPVTATAAELAFHAAVAAATADLRAAWGSPP